MNRSCLYCHSGLGGNDVAPSHPVGERLAFDAERGRLWVVCPRCGRWNLAPLGNRWDAIQELEAAYDASPLQYDDEGIGLAVVRGTELIRVGAEESHALTALRYGNHFEARHGSWTRVTTALQWLTFSFLGLATVAGGVAGGFWGAWFSMIVTLVALAVIGTRYDPVLARIPVGDDEWRSIRHNEARVLRLVPDESELGWHLALGGDDAVRGRLAYHALALLLPPINEQEYGDGDVRKALAYIRKKGGDPDSVIAAAAHRWGAGKTVHLSTLDPHIRLALEIVVHEEAERLEMKGALAVLRRQWEHAEELASIADGLALPSGVERAWRRLTEGGRAAPDPGP